MFGPTMGDRVRLGDSNLWVEVEKDYTVYGDECKFGGGEGCTRVSGTASVAATDSMAGPGKTLRDGQGQASNLSDRDVLDLVVTNALVIDWSGICKVGLCSCEARSLGRALLTRRSPDPLARPTSASRTARLPGSERLGTRTLWTALLQI